MDLRQQNSYKDFLSIARNYKNDLFIAGETPVVNRFLNHTDSGPKNGAVIFMTDLTRKRYVCMHKGILQTTGYKAEKLLDGGLDFYFDKMPKTDFKIYNEQVFPECIRFLSSHPPEKYPDLIFSRNNRVIRRDGTVMNLLQRFSFIADPINGVPVGVIGTVTDITHYRNDESIIQTIEEIKDSETLTGTKLLFKRAYFPDESFTVLTKKETEVLKWMSEGLSSKQIAGKLKVSIHTTSNHRQNMLHKTNCKNSAELIHYGINRHII